MPGILPPGKSYLRMIDVPELSHRVTRAPDRFSWTIVRQSSSTPRTVSLSGA